MTDREKKLAAVVAAVALLWGGSTFYTNYSEWYDMADNARISAQNGVNDASLQLARARKARKQLNDLRERSLPADTQVAKSNYRDWLIDQLKESRLNYDQVKPGKTSPQADPFATIPFTVTTSGDLKSVVLFLDKFYRANHLHKITSFDLQPEPEGNDLAVTIQIEALTLAGTKRKKELAEGTSDRLVRANAEEYIETIAERKPFSEYKRPRPEPRQTVRVEPRETPRERTPRFDESKRAKFTGAVTGTEPGKLVAWIRVQTSDEKLHLSEGDEFSIGELNGRVSSVSLREFVYVADGETLSVKIGKSLREGEKVASSPGDAGG